MLVTLAMSIFSLGVAGMNSTIPRLVGEDELTAAIAIENVYGSTTNVAGPALGGVLIAVLGLKGAYLSDAATFTASLWSVWRLPALAPAHDAERPSLRTIAEGFRFVRAKKVLLGMFLVDSNAMVFGMPRALFPALALNRFDGGAGVARPDVRRAVCRRARGLARLRLDRSRAPAGPRRLHRGRRSGAWRSLSSASPRRSGSRSSCSRRPAPPTTSAPCCAGRSSGGVTPDPLRGRVSGIEFAQVAATPALGNVEAGLVASLTSVRFSIVSGGLLCVVGTFVIAACRPRLHPLRRRALPGVSSSPAPSTRSRPS